MAATEVNVASIADDPNSKTITENSAPKYVQKWNFMFITSCVFAVSLDPLFLYVPILNYDMKCLRLDNNLKITALVSRSVTDLFYIANIVFQVYRYKICSNLIKLFLPGSWSSKLAELRKIWQSYIIVDILAILPLPQVIILIFFSKMRASRSLRKLMNFLVMVQYVPRVLRIYLSCKKSKKPFKGHTALWVKGLLNFFLYILASHVLGAFWYFFAVQRMTSCWQHSGILWSTNYPLKFSNSFCWGLRNLSSLASNLEPSSNTWEILFVACISIIGLLLFVYLIGNLQTYVLLDTERLESHRRKMRLERKMKAKGRDVELWLSKNGTPLRRKPDIMEKVRLELEENWDIDVDQEILSILPRELQDYIETCKPLSRLKNVEVPPFRNMDEQVLIEISKHLKPRSYTNNQIIIKEDQPLEMMLFVVDGRVIIKKKDCSSKFQRRAGHLYGEKLLVWPSWTSFHEGTRPLATESVQAIDDVEALVLLASDMVSIRSRFRSDFDKLKMSLSQSQQTDSHWELLTCDKVTMLQQVPKLRDMDKQVLKAMSEHLQSNVYGHNVNIVQEYRPLNMMFFVTRGKVINDETGRAGNIFGEELVEWVLDKSFPEILPLSTCTAKVDSNDAEFLVLTAEVLKSLASDNFVSHFSKIASPLDLFTFVRLTRLKKVEIFREMDKQVLEAISERLYTMTYPFANTPIIPEKKQLKMMFFVVRGVVNIKSDSTIEGPKTCQMGGFYGEELAHWVTTWVSHSSFPAKLPLPTGSAVSGPHGTVEILALSADDLKSVLSKFRSNFTSESTLLTYSQSESLTRDPLTIVKNVERLKTMDEKVLKEICEHLRPRKYEDEDIIQLNKPMEMMFFIVKGVVAVTNEYWKHYRNEAERSNHSGDDLIEYWARSKYTVFFAELPLSPFSFRAIGEVEVLVLMANDLAKVQPRRSAPIIDCSIIQVY
ncbi:hypothetical protein PRUPE_2G222500 [Prunus persica]|uniref:Cyclic nucleotide-binding domain-containing protein n=1 Tax=Prunus persica TaxID=3760 RepID=A0A251QJR2_PRUPE|nr:cyclic nucleotide-gated ion channel 17 isoform X3 [Prunus persica]ONI24077.1 hypothetical protein PRUPE_2G222500 [Prunus persica]